MKTKHLIRATALSVFISGSFLGNIALANVNIDDVVSAVKANPENALMLAVDFVAESPEQIAEILDAILNQVEDPALRTAIIEAAYEKKNALADSSSQANEAEELAELEEVEPETEAELQEVAVPTPAIAPPPPPAFAPGSNDKPSGVSPT